MLREHPDLYALAEDWELQSAQVGIGRFRWNDSYPLSDLRRFDEAQVEMLREPREQACAICQW